MSPIKKVLPIFFLCILLTGCRINAAIPSEPVVIVTQVNVDYRYRQNHLQRRYTNSDKMDVILHYLYHLSPGGQPEGDPEQIRNDFCKITLTLSNGEHRIYRQIGSRYLSVNDHPWQTINQTQGSVLYHLVNHIQSDE